MCIYFYITAYIHVYIDGYWYIHLNIIYIHVTTGNKDNYNDVSSSWQACIVAADFSYIPISSTIQSIQEQIDAKTQNTKICVNTAYTNYCSNSQTCAYAIISCLQGTTASLPSIPDIPIPNGYYTTGLSYLGVETIIFSSFALASTYRSLRHPSWLISNIVLCFWFTFAILAYYTVNPIIPAPTQINSTLITYLYYSRSYHKYRNLNNGDNHCKLSFQIVWVYQVSWLISHW